MQAFIQPYQYHFLKDQMEILLQSHTSNKDNTVLKALEAVTWEKIDNIFNGLTNEQEQLFQPLRESVREKRQMEINLLNLKEFVIPFAAPSDKQIQKLFRKVKKLKLPKWEELDLHELTYIGWDDPGQQRKYIVANHDGELVGIRGTFKVSHHKGICAICHQHTELGLFMAETKRSGDGTFASKGNYICSDSIQCNQKLTQLDRFQQFIEIVKEEK